MYVAWHKQTPTQAKMNTLVCLCHVQVFQVQPCLTINPLTGLSTQKAQQLPNTSTHQPANTRTHKLNNPPTSSNPPPHPSCQPRQPVNSSTNKTNSSKLKSILFILQIPSNFHAILAKILAKRQENSYHFHLLTPLALSIFKNKTRILHHFAFLVWLEVQIFSTPITPILPLKTHFSIGILPL